MTRLFGLRSIMLAATAANATPVSEIANPRPPAAVPTPAPFAPTVLAAAGGHDSVGGLIPLPLWPPYTPHAYMPRAYAPAPQVWKHKVRCSAHACPH
jgi:hypothetical protein